MRGEETDSLLQDYVSYLRARRGECPAEETLAAFQKGALPEKLSGEVEAPVEICGLCQMGLAVLGDFERYAGTDIAEPAHWPEAERRGRAQFDAFLQSRAQKAPRPAAGIGFFYRLKAVFSHPAFAYLLALALLYPAYRGLSRKPDAAGDTTLEREVVVVEKPGPTLSLATLPTFKLRIAERSATQSRPAVRLSPDKAFFALAFLVPISERPEFVYDLEIRDEKLQVVAAEPAARPQDWLGNFLLVCNRELFRPGYYELRVSEVNKTTRAVRRAFAFPFTVEGTPQ